MRYKFPNFLCFSVLLFSFITACQNQSENLKYEGGKDTVVLFGDGTYQILRDPSVLYNMEQQMEVETNVKKYKENKPFVYVIGDSGFTILNYETGVLKRYKTIEEIPQNEAKLFKDIMNE